jgi:hypothetical protein
MTPYKTATAAGARPLLQLAVDSRPIAHDRALDTGAIVRTFRPILPSGITQPVTFDTNVTSSSKSRPHRRTAGGISCRRGKSPTGSSSGTRTDASGAWTSDTGSGRNGLQVYFDAHYDGAFDAGQPIQTQPVLSVDPQG